VLGDGLSLSPRRSLVSDRIRSDLIAVVLSPPKLPTLSLVLSLPIASSSLSYVPPSTARHLIPIGSLSFLFLPWLDQLPISQPFRCTRTPSTSTSPTPPTPPSPLRLPRLPHRPLSSASPSPLRRLLSSETSIPNGGSFCFFLLSSAALFSFLRVC
jgi:hypothetical protein